MRMPQLNPLFHSSPPFVLHLVYTVLAIVIYVEILHHLQLLVIRSYSPIATIEFNHVM